MDPDFQSLAESLIKRVKVDPLSVDLGPYLEKEIIITVDHNTQKESRDTMIAAGELLKPIYQGLKIDILSANYNISKRTITIEREIFDQEGALIRRTTSEYTFNKLNLIISIKEWTNNVGPAGDYIKQKLEEPATEQLLIEHLTDHWAKRALRKVAGLLSQFK